MQDKLIPDVDALCEPPEVHQATGMISANLGISCGHALAKLRGYATAAGSCCAEVAEAVVDRRLQLHHFSNPAWTTTNS